MKSPKNQFLASPSLRGCVCCAVASSSFRVAKIFAALGHVKMLCSSFGLEMRVKNPGERRWRERKCETGGSI